MAHAVHPRIAQCINAMHAVPTQCEWSIVKCRTFREQETEIEHWLCVLPLYGDYCVPEDIISHPSSPAQPCPSMQLSYLVNRVISSLNL